MLAANGLPLSPLYGKLPEANRSYLALAITLSHLICPEAAQPMADGYRGTED